MAEKLVFDVLTKASGAADVKKLGDALDGVGRSADDLGKKSGIFSKLTSGADGAGKSVTSSLGSAFSKIGQTAAKAGVEVGTSLASNVTKGLESLGPAGAAGGAVLFGALIGAAPAAGAAIGAALIAGVGLAGIGAGIALSLQDPEIKAAAGDLGTDIMNSLRVAAVPFKAPVLAAIAELDVAWQKSLGDVQRLFANTAPLVAPLAEAFGTAANSLTKGIADASAAAAPVLGALGEGVKMLGESIGSGLSSLADNGAAAATALTVAFVLIKAGVDATFAAVDGLTTAFGWLAENGVLGPGVAASYQVWKAKLDESTTSMDSLGTATQSTTSMMRDQANALKEQTDPILALTTAQTNMTQKQVAYNTAVKEHGVNSQQAKQASMDLLGATSQLQGAVTTAAEAGFDGTLTPAMRRAMEASGRSKTEIDAVATALQEAYNKAKQYEGTSTRRIVTIYEQIGKPSSETTLSSQTAKGLRWGGIVNAARGLTTRAGIARGGADLIHWAEPQTGGEAFIPRRGSESRSRAIATTVVEDWLGGKISWPDSGSGTSSGGSVPQPRGSRSTAVDAGSSGGGNGGLLSEVRQLRRAIQDLQRRPVTAVSREGRNAQLIVRTG